MIIDPSHIAYLENAKSGEEAYKWLLINHGSYSRMGVLLASRKFMQSQVFYKALGSIWSISDDITKHRFVLYRVFANATRHQLDLMMWTDLIFSTTPKERIFDNLLP